LNGEWGGLVGQLFSPVLLYVPTNIEQFFSINKVKFTSLINNYQLADLSNISKLFYWHQQGGFKHG
jgi:hypothetical protein